MSWIPLSPDSFLNSLYQNPNLLLENLPKLTQIQDGDKLIFKDTGIIDKEPDSYSRSGWGLLKRWAFSSEELEIHRLQKYAGAFYTYYRVHVIRPDKLHEVIFNIHTAVGGLIKLQRTYENQGEYKKINVEIVAKAIDTFQATRKHIIAECHKKMGTPLNIYAKNFVFLVPITHTYGNPVHVVMPLIEDSFHDLLQIKGDPVFERIQKIYFQTPSLFTDLARFEALAKIMLRECSSLVTVL